MGSFGVETFPDIIPLFYLEDPLVKLMVGKRFFFFLGLATETTRIIYFIPWSGKHDSTMDIASSHGQASINIISTTPFF